MDAFRDRESWQTRRSSFNHAWLKNTLIPSIAALDNAAATPDAVEIADGGEAMIRHALSDWAAHGAEAKILAESFEVEMSPAHLLNLSFLASCNEETREWLPALLHELWLLRYPVRHWVSSVTSAYAEAEKASSELRSRAEALYAKGDFRLPAAEVRAFYEACLALARSIEALPSEVRAV